MKKKFKDTTVGKIIIGATSLIPGVGEPLSEVLKGVATPLEALKHIQESGLPKEDKYKLTELLINADAEEQSNITKRWQADLSSDSWLSKNIRPLILAFFSLAYVIGWYFDYDTININSIMLLILGGYFGARSIEKVINNRYPYQKQK